MAPSIKTSFILRYLHSSGFVNHAKRVYEGQKAMSHFIGSHLGWLYLPIDNNPRFFSVRELSPYKLKFPIKTLDRRKEKIKQKYYKANFLTMVDIWGKETALGQIKGHQDLVKVLNKSNPNGKLPS